MCSLTNEQVIKIIVGQSMDIIKEGEGHFVRTVVDKSMIERLQEDEDGE